MGNLDFLCICLYSIIAGKIFVCEFFEISDKIIKKSIWKRSIIVVVLKYKEKSRRKEL